MHGRLIGQSIMIVGGAGLGKTRMVAELYSKTPMVELTPLDLKDPWHPTDGFDKLNKMYCHYNHRTNGRVCPARPKTKPVAAPEYAKVFLDEIHLEGHLSPFAFMLRPLTEELEGLPCARPSCCKHYWRKRKNDKVRLCFIFASSAYGSKEEFLSKARAQNNVAMRDFAHAGASLASASALEAYPRAEVHHRLQQD